MSYDFSLSHEEAVRNTADKVKIKQLINFEQRNADRIKVSVIVPVCNVQRYVKECVRSVQNQTLRDIEIICVNDGSKDDSMAVLQSLANRDRRIRVIDKENAGYGHTMNIGMDMAVGKYIVIVESDDYVEPDMLEILYTTAEKYRLDVVKTDYYTFSTKNSGRIQQYESTCLGKSEYYGKVLVPAEHKEIFTFQMNTWTGIYNREFLIRNNIRHNETPGASYQDNGFWFQTISLAKSVMFLCQAFYHYRQDNPNSSINSKGKVYCMNEEYDYIYAFIASHEQVKEQFLKQYFAKMFHNYLHTYSRIADEFKLPYLERFSQELKTIRQTKGINIYDIGDEWITKQCLRIIDNYKCFYYEDTIYRLETQLSDAKERRQRLRASKELTKGKRITRAIKRLLRR